MTIYVDPLMDFGWKLRGSPTENCHMFTDEIDLSELHRIAEAIGLKRAWFQDSSSAPHYDLTPSRRRLAIQQGAVEIGHKEAGMVWRMRREAVRK